jgi:thiamine-phosphate pyrophosphorylase
VTGAARRRRLAATRLCLVVGAAAGARAWLDAVGRALASGRVGAVQLREKDVDDDEFLARAAELRGIVSVLRDDAPLLILNDRAHLVAEAGADGVHLGEDDMDPVEARALLGPDVLIGVSTHDRGEIEAAVADGADYVGLGPCFASTTKRLTRAPRGTALAAEAAGAAVPAFLIGGITAGNAPLLARAGARRLAVGAGILSAPDPSSAAEAIAAALGA